MPDHVIKIFTEKMSKLSANRGEPDQTPKNAASDLGLHCLSFTLLGFSRLNVLKDTCFLYLFL